MPKDKEEIVQEEKAEQQMTIVIPPEAVDAYRRLQLNDVTPSDIEGVIEDEKKIAQYDVKKEHNWIAIAIAVVVIMMAVPIVLMILGKALQSWDTGDGGGGSIINLGMMLIGGSMLKTKLCSAFKRRKVDKLARKGGETDE